MADWRQSVPTLGGGYGRVRCEPGWSLRPGWARALRDCDLWFVWRGRGEMTLDGGEVVPLRPGLCFWMWPGRRYEATQDPADRLGVTFIHFSLGVPPTGPQRRALPAYQRVPQSGYADGLLSRVVTLRRAGDTGLAARLLQGFLLDYASGFPGVRGRRLSGPHGRAIEDLLGVIDAEPGRGWGVAEMAAACHVSADHFTRLFAQAVGTTPRRYVIGRRTERARHLLTQTGLSVGEVARALGYRDVYYFSRQFRAEVGQSPARFRMRAGGGTA